MAEKYHLQQQATQGYPLAPSTTIPRSDVEIPPTTNHEMIINNKRRTKRLAYTAALVLILTIVILVFALIVARVRTPRACLTHVAVANSFNNSVRLTARVSVRNRNFGRYEFEGGVVTVWSGDGDQAGQFVIGEGHVRARSTWRTYVIADLTRNTNSSVVDLRVEGRMRGKVRVVLVIRRSRWAEMSCSMSLHLSTNDVQGLRCE